MDGKKAAIIAGIGCLAVGGITLATVAGGTVLYFATRGGTDQGGAARPVVSGSKVTGLFYMQKYWIATRHLEKAVWYFAPDGRVYFNPEAGLSPAELATVKSAHQGHYKVGGGKLSVTWADGKKSDADLEIVPGGFNWDTGLFAPVVPFADARQIVGSYEGGTSVSLGGNSAMVVKSLELRADGTFSSAGISSFDTGGTRTGGQSATTGTWTLSGYALSLTTQDGKVVRGLTFPQDDEKTPIQPDRMFFGGISYKKR